MKTLANTFYQSKDKTFDYATCVSRVYIGCLLLSIAGALHRRNVGYVSLIFWIVILYFGHIIL
jgi:hypothetical protein